MTVTVRPVCSEDLPHVQALVHDAGLPLDGLDTAALVLVATDHTGILGTAAVESHGQPLPALLLRSVAVADQARGHGVGAALTRAALAYADEQHAPVALLTETAQDYFSRFGFRAVAREDLPVALHASAELQGACPASAPALLRPPGS